MSTSPVTPPTSGSGTTPTNELPSGQSLNNMFLQLLVAQLQNQDPTDPVDPSQFVGQLAQFSELSEVTSIYTLLQQAIPQSGSSGSSGSGSSGSGSGSSGNTALPSGAVISQPAAAIAPGASVGGTPSPMFNSPVLSALTSKIQGAF